MKKQSPPQKSLIQTLEQLFELAGSSTKLAASLNLHTYSVENWRRIGIPLRNWAILIDTYNLTPDELYGIYRQCVNQKALGEK